MDRYLSESERLVQDGMTDLRAPDGSPLCNAPVEQSADPKDLATERRHRKEKAMDTIITCEIHAPAESMPPKDVVRILFGTSIEQLVKDMHSNPDHPLLRGEERA